MERHRTWELVGRSALAVGAVLLASAGWLALVLGGCDWATGPLCEGDVGALLEGYVAGGVLMALAAALGARACTRRWPWVVLAAVVALAASTVFVLFREGLL